MAQAGLKTKRQVVFDDFIAVASWMGEYGDPDDSMEREFLESISPYHNVKADRQYPEILFVTSTKDDRVHLGHARKMAARLEEMGYDFLYYENIDGGHSAATSYGTNRQAVRAVTLQ